MSFMGLIWRKVISPAFRVWMRARGIGCRGTLVIYGFPIVGLHANSVIDIGVRVVMCSKSKFTALGVTKPVILRALTEGARIEIGNDVGLSGAVVCARASVSIGDNCLIGADVVITDSDFHAIIPNGRRYGAENILAAPVVIGRNVFIGTGSIVLKGVTIGENSVIGAGSVVAKSIPPNSIAAGNPCRVLRPIKEV